MKKERVEKNNDSVEVQTRRGFFAYLSRHPILESALIALVLNFLMEIISRRSLISAVSFTVHSPHFFLAGWAVIFLTLSLAPLFPKKIFIYCLFGILWLSMAITNAVLVVVRTAPFEAVDFSIIRTGLGIITIYLKIWQIILISLAIVAALALAWTVYVAAVTKYSDGEESDPMRRRRVGLLVGGIVYLQLAALIAFTLVNQALKPLLVAGALLLILLRVMRLALQKVRAS